MPLSVDDVGPRIVNGPNTYAGQPEYPPWMSERATRNGSGDTRAVPKPGEPKPKPTPREPGQLPESAQHGPPSTALGAVGQFLSGLTLLGMLHGLDHWAKPTLQVAKYPNAANPLAVIAKAIDVLTNWWKPRQAIIGHEVSKGAAHAQHSPAQTLGVLALRWEQLVWQFAYFVHETDLVVGRLVNHKIPREIALRLAPVKLRVGRVERTSGKALTEARGVRRQLGRVLNREIRPEIQTLKRTTQHTLPARINRVDHRARQAQKLATKDHIGVVKLLPLLTVLGATGLVLKAFGKLGLNFLRCQNVKDFGNEMCASPPGTGRGLARFFRGLPAWFLSLLPLLFAGLWDVLAIVDFCGMTKAMIAVAESGPVQAALRSFVEGMDDLLECQGVDVAPEMHVPTVGYPPAQAYASYPLS
jgi:hypothetical protein